MTRQSYGRGLALVLVVLASLLATTAAAQDYVLAGSRVVLHLSDVTTNGAVRYTLTFGSPMPFCPGGGIGLPYTAAIKFDPASSTPNFLIYLQAFPMDPSTGAWAIDVHPKPCGRYVVYRFRHGVGWEFFDYCSYLVYWPPQP